MSNELNESCLEYIPMGILDEIPVILKEMETTWDTDLIPDAKDPFETEQQLNDLLTDRIKQEINEEINEEISWE